jgi:hypothetical protein
MSTTDTQQLDGEALLRVARAVERLDVSWRRGEPIPLEELLRGWSGAERRALLRHALYVELKHRRDRGEVPTAEEYAGRFPDDAATLHAVFAEPETIAPASDTTAAPPSSGPSFTPWPTAPAPPPLPATIGKYLVIGRLGKGGQGSTYLARDPDLGRIVGPTRATRLLVCIRPVNRTGRELPPSSIGGRRSPPLERAHGDGARIWSGSRR